MASPAPTTNITQAHRDQFNAISSGEYTNFALFSCFVNGEPTSVIAAIDDQGYGDILITPLFVAVTPGMTLTDHDGRPA